MTTLLQKHPDLKDTLYMFSKMKIYKILDHNNRIQEFWEKDSSGHWTDQTLREKLREEIEIQQNEITRLEEKVK